MQLDNFSDLVPSREQKTTPPGARRLVIAVILAIAAVGGLTLAERLRDRVPSPTPPHEPSQALMTTAAPVPEQIAPAQVPPPPPPEVRNDERLQAPRAPDPVPSIVEGKPTGKPVAASEAPYMVQLGVFMTTTNAQALQKQLKRAGIDAHLETFVKVGPFKDKKEAEKALARAKRLGLKPVLVGPPANQ